jgi:hypothetical protein
MKGTGHRDNTGDHKYFSQIPHLLDDSELSVYEHRLYCHYKRRCSPNEVCYESIRTSALACNMSKSQIARARNGLAEKGWIMVQLDGTGRGHTVEVALCDRWQENMDRYSKQSSEGRLEEERPSEGRNVPDRGRNVPVRATKNNPLRRGGEEDTSPVALLPERGTHKSIDLTEMAKTFPAVDVDREYAKFRDWRSAKGRRFKDDRAAFRNWLRKAEEFAAERKQRGTARAGRGAVRTDADLAEWDAYKRRVR